MKRNIVNNLILICATFFMLSACSDDDLSPSQPENSSQVVLSLNVQGEKKVEMSTRALDETSISAVWVAVVHADQTVECRNFETVSDDKITISDVRILEGDTLHVFANTGVSSVPTSISKEELLKHFTCTQEQVNGGIMMMYGKFPEKEGDTNSQNITVNLYRTPAKVTVKSEVAGHSVTQFKVCRIPNSGYISNADGYPDATSVSSNPEVIDPADLSENHPIYFIPRKDNSTVGVKENTCLLVQLEGKQGWYRLDFYLGTDPIVDGDKAQIEDIIRNNWYNFTIKSVNNDGYGTEKEALDNIGSNIVYSMDITSSPDISTNGQYSLISDKEIIILGANETTPVVLSALLTPEIELSTYKVKIVCPSGQLELIDAISGEKDFLEGDRTLKKADDSKRTVQIKSTGSNLLNSYLECRLGNIIKIIPITLKTANCYILDLNTPGKKTSISILQANSDGTERISGDDVTPVFLWSDNPIAKENFEMVYNPNGKSIDITNKVPYSGNIIIGASVGGVIKWSWHLWCFAPGQLSSDQKVMEKPYMEYTWMDRALGAYDLNDPNGCAGLLYQHGRKDPFVGKSWAADPVIGERDEPSIYYYDSQFTMKDNHPYFGDACIQTKNEENNIEFAISHPFVFIRGNRIHISGTGHETEVDSDWATNSLEARNKTLDLWVKDGEKTIYDPCPYGWRVPEGHTAGPFAGFLLNTQQLQSSSCSWPEAGVFYYAAMRRDAGELIHMTSVGRIHFRWAEVFADKGAANCTSMGPNELVYRLRDVTRCLGVSIRCVKDE